jgi:hypothetical protein
LFYDSYFFGISCFPFNLFLPVFIS